MTEMARSAAVTAILLAVLLAAGHGTARAQGEATGQAVEFAELESKADEVVKVNLWGRSLDHAKRLLGLRKNVKESVKSFMVGLTSVYRRTYRFNKSQPSADDVDDVRSHLAETGWVPLIETEDRSTPESMSVYSYYEDEQVAGMTVLSSEPDEVTVLKIMGPVDFEALSEIGTGMGLPPLMNVATTEIQQAAEAPGER